MNRLMRHRTSSERSNAASASAETKTTTVCQKKSSATPSRWSTQPSTPTPNPSPDGSFYLASIPIASNGSFSGTTTVAGVIGNAPVHITYTFSGQYFQATGTSDTALYGGSPDSSGWNWEIAYVPSGKLDSWFPTYFNARLSLQYTMYNKFDGNSVNAADNNTLFLLLWLAG